MLIDQFEYEREKEEKRERAQTKMKRARERVYIVPNRSNSTATTSTVASTKQQHQKPYPVAKAVSHDGSETVTSVASTVTSLSSALFADWFGGKNGKSEDSGASKMSWVKNTMASSPWASPMPSTPNPAKSPKVDKDGVEDLLADSNSMDEPPRSGGIDEKEESDEDDIDSETMSTTLDEFRKNNSLLADSLSEFSGTTNTSGAIDDNSLVPGKTTFFTRKRHNRRTKSAPTRSKSASWVRDDAVPEDGPFLTSVGDPKSGSEDLIQHGFYTNDHLPEFPRHEMQQPVNRTRRYREAVVKEDEEHGRGLSFGISLPPDEWFEPYAQFRDAPEECLSTQCHVVSEEQPKKKQQQDQRKAAIGIADQNRLSSGSDVGCLPTSISVKKKSPKRNKTPSPSRRDNMENECHQDFTGVEVKLATAAALDQIQNQKVAPPPVATVHKEKNKRSVGDRIRQRLSKQKPPRSRSSTPTKKRSAPSTAEIASALSGSAATTSTTNPPSRRSTRGRSSLHKSNRSPSPLLEQMETLDTLANLSYDSSEPTWNIHELTNPAISPKESPQTSASSSPRQSQRGRKPPATWKNHSPEMWTGSDVRFYSNEQLYREMDAQLSQNKKAIEAIVKPTTSISVASIGSGGSALSRRLQRRLVEPRLLVGEPLQEYDEKDYDGVTTLVFTSNIETASPASVADGPTNPHPERKDEVPPRRNLRGCVRCLI